MPPTIPQSPTPLQRNITPRLILYHQTHSHKDTHVSLLPLLTYAPHTTHVILAALHLNPDPGHITLNNHHWNDPYHARLFAEVPAVKRQGIKILVMLGGAAQGTYPLLDTASLADFHAYYDPLRNMLRSTGMDGIDLDVEEPMSLPGIIRLIDHLAADFGPSFLITLAPVAPALQDPAARHLSGFSYADLEKAVGRHIAWYNVQFYCGWGSVATGEGYHVIMEREEWPAEKVMLGMVTNPGNGSGWVEGGVAREVVRGLREIYPGFGGVMGWEYFNAVTRLGTEGNGDGEPWQWARTMGDALGLGTKEIKAGEAERSGESVGSGVVRGDNPFLNLLAPSARHVP